MGGEATPEDVADLEADNAAMRGDMMADAAPMPEKPYSVKAIDTLIKDFNDSLESLAGSALPDVEWAPPDGTGGKWRSQKP
jgi:hypothetical protein